MAFFREPETKRLYFSPIFSRRGDSNCSGKLCILSPRAQKLTYLIPFLALVMFFLFSMIVSRICIPTLAVAFDLEDANVWIMAWALIPGACTTTLLIFCQLASLKSRVYYEQDHGPLEIHRLLSISTYFIYTLMLAIIGIGYMWMHKNPLYDSEEMPFLPVMMVLLASVSAPMWLRLAWVCRKWKCPGILWTPGRHF